MRKLFLKIKVGLLTYEIKAFYDWFDVADYIKQENLKGHSVTITDWWYRRDK